MELEDLSKSMKIQGFKAFQDDFPLETGLFLAGAWQFISPHGGQDERSPRIEEVKIHLGPGTRGWRGPVDGILQVFWSVGLEFCSYWPV